MIHGYGCISKELIDIVKAHLDESPFKSSDERKIRIWYMNSENGNTHSPQVFYENISFFKLVIYIHNDYDPNIRKLMNSYKNFKFYLESIRNSCVNEIDNRGFIVIIVDTPKNLPDVLRQVNVEQWSSDFEAERKDQFKEKLVELLRECARNADMDDLENPNSYELV